MKFVYAYDKIIKRRVPFVLLNGYAISMVTNTRFRWGKMEHEVEK